MGKVYHFNDLEEFFGSDDWKLQINITDIWNEYNQKKISVQDFNKKYYNRLLEYKTDISNLGNDIWIDLEKSLVKLNTNEPDLSSVYDDIYDWADRNDVLIKTK